MKKSCCAAGFIIFHPLAVIFVKTTNMKKAFFKFLAKTNKLFLPSYSKQRLNLAKASTFQLAIIGWRYYITTNAIA